MRFREVPQLTPSHTGHKVWQDERSARSWEKASRVPGDFLKLSLSLFNSGARSDRCYQRKAAPATHPEWHLPPCHALPWAGFSSSRIPWMARGGGMGHLIRGGRRYATSPSLAVELGLPNPGSTRPQEPAPPPLCARGLLGAPDSGASADTAISRPGPGRFLWALEASRPRMFKLKACPELAPCPLPLRRRVPAVALPEI